MLEFLQTYTNMHKGLSQTLYLENLEDDFAVQIRDIIKNIHKAPCFMSNF